MTAISLFTGIGGFDLGLEAAGFRVVLQVENNPQCLKILNQHWPYIYTIGGFYMSQIEKKDWSEFRATGLLWFINTILHVFGWAIVVNLNGENEVIGCYPARVTFRGFSETNNEVGYIQLTEYMNANAQILLDEVKLNWDAAEKYLYQVKGLYEDIGQSGKLALQFAINPLEKRFSSGERTLELYNSIMNLK